MAGSLLLQYEANELYSKNEVAIRFLKSLVIFWGRMTISVSICRRRYYDESVVDNIVHCDEVRVGSGEGVSPLSWVRFGEGLCPPQEFF